MTTIGLIADTHGLLLRGAGRLALLTSIRGNIDKTARAHALGHTAVFEMGGAALTVLDGRNTIAVDRIAAGFGAVISGQSYQPGYAWRHSELYLDRGSAGPRRSLLPTITGRLIVI